jgi:hypothetical protein
MLFAIAVNGTPISPRNITRIVAVGDISTDWECFSAWADVPLNNGDRVSLVAGTNQAGTIYVAAASLMVQRVK